MSTVHVSPMAAWESFFEEMSLFFRSAERQMSSRLPSESFTHYVLEKITIYCSSVSSLLANMRATLEDGSTNHSESSIISEYVLLLEEIYQYLRSTAQEWDLHLDEINQNFSYLSPTVQLQGRLGRPRFDISRDQLEYLSSMSFTWTQISSMLGVSRMTIYRRRVEYGISSRPGHVLSDDDLAIVLEDVSAEQPAMGETMMWGKLKSLGFDVTRRQLRHVLSELDPLQRALRWSTQLTRRQPYSVPGPNSLWHIGE